LAQLTASTGSDPGVATFLASVATGVISTLGYSAIFLLDFGSEISPSELIATLLNGLAFGFLLGALMIWPICRLFTAIGIGLAERYAIACRKSVWITSGFLSGLFVMVALLGVATDFDPVMMLSGGLMGCFPGAIVAGLTHTLLGVAP
jgi:hypothetical protein